MQLPTELTEEQTAEILQGDLPWPVRQGAWKQGTMLKLCHSGHP